MKMRELVREEVRPYPGIPTVPSWGDLDEEQQKLQARKMELYAALVENLDFHVGRLVKYLEEKDELRNTTIVFLSDNGAEPANRGPNGMDRRDGEWYAQQFPKTDMAEWGRPGSFVEYGPGWAQVSTVPFRLFKGTQAEGGIRAPIIISGMGVKSQAGHERRDRPRDGRAGDDPRPRRRRPPHEPSPGAASCRWRAPPGSACAGTSSSRRPRTSGWASSSPATAPCAWAAGSWCG